MATNPIISGRSPEEVDPMNFVYAIIMSLGVFFISGLFLDHFDSYPPYAYTPILYLAVSIIGADVLKKPGISIAILMLPVVLVAGDLILRKGINGKFQFPLSLELPVRIYFKAMFMPALCGTFVGGGVAAFFVRPPQLNQQPPPAGNSRPRDSIDRWFDNPSGFHLAMAGLVLAAIGIVNFLTAGKFYTVSNFLFAVLNVIADCFFIGAGIFLIVASFFR
jgi:hypothetical protein